MSEKCVGWVLQVRPIAEDEMFRVLRTGKRKSQFSCPFIGNFHLFVSGLYLDQMVSLYGNNRVSLDSTLLFKLMLMGPLFTAAKQWKRMVTKVTFVGPGFTRKPPKYERFIRPMGLRFTKAHVTHPELKCTFNLEIIGVKKNPNGPMYTSMGVITKGTVIEVHILDKCLFLQISAGLLHCTLNLFRCIFRYMHFKNCWFTSCNTFSIIEVYRSKISSNVPSLQFQIHRDVDSFWNLFLPFFSTLQRNVLWFHVYLQKKGNILCAWKQVNVSELGLVTPAGKVVWGEFSSFFKPSAFCACWSKSRTSFSCGWSLQFESECLLCRTKSYLASSLVCD